MNAWPKSARQTWATLGSYYCTFPLPFARDVIEAYCPVGGAVLDPFCGRGTAPYVARVTGRTALGIDQSPVAHVFSAAKCDPEPGKDRLVRLAHEIRAAKDPNDVAPTEFMSHAYSPRIFRFLMSARRNLNWRHDRTDRTLMALILADLHDKIPYGLSNQMGRVIAPSPDYAVRWWRDRGMSVPPDFDPVVFLERKIAARYHDGVPNFPSARIEIGDAREMLECVGHSQEFDLILTSPPYAGVSDYRRDQWLRLWMLGDEPRPHSSDTSQKWTDKAKYESMMTDVFRKSASMLKPGGVIYVRTDHRAFTRDLTLELVESVSPSGHRIFWRHEVPVKATITEYQSPGRKKTPGEVDIVSLPSHIAAPVGFTELNIGKMTSLAA